MSGGFGVRGEIRLASYTAEPLALLDYGPLLREDGSPAPALTGGRLAKPGGTDLIVRARGVESKEAADALRGLRLFIPRSALPPPDDDDDFYLADLIGLAAITPEGEPLGRVNAVHDFGAGDILEIDPGDGRTTALYPFTREVAPEVNVAQGRLVLVPPAEVEEDEPSGR